MIFVVPCVSLLLGFDCCLLFVLAAFLFVVFVWLLLVRGVPVSFVLLLVGDW